MILFKLWMLKKSIRKKSCFWHWLFDCRYYIVTRQVRLMLYHIPKTLLNLVLPNSYTGSLTSFYLYKSFDRNWYLNMKPKALHSFWHYPPQDNYISTNVKHRFPSCPPRETQRSSYLVNGSRQIFNLSFVVVISTPVKTLG